MDDYKKLQQLKRKLSKDLDFLDYIMVAKKDLQWLLEALESRLNSDLWDMEDDFFSNINYYEKF